MAYIDTQNQKSLERIAASLEKIQKDLRSIAESANHFSKALKAFKTETEQANMLDRIEQVKLLHNNGLGENQISELLGLDLDIIRKCEEDDNE